MASRPTLNAVSAMELSSGGKKVRIAELDLPTSRSLAKADDEFTGRMPSAVNGMLLDLLAAVARKDCTDRCHRPAEGTVKAKAAGSYKGQTEDKTCDDLRLHL